MLPFAVAFTPGESPYRQIVYAATRAIVAGELAAGERFPSVRELSQALKVNPNTVQKAVAELTRDGLLEVRPGIGTVVTAKRPRSAAEKRQLLSTDVERLLVEARRLGVGVDEVIEAVEGTWERLFAGEDAEQGNGGRANRRDG